MKLPVHLVDVRLVREDHLLLGRVHAGDLDLLFDALVLFFHSNILLFQLGHTRAELLRLFLVLAYHQKRVTEKEDDKAHDHDAEGADYGDDLVSEKGEKSGEGLFESR